MVVISGKILSLMSVRYLFALSEVGSTQRKMQKLSWDKYWMLLPIAIFRVSCTVILNLRWNICVVFLRFLLPTPPFSVLQYWTQLLSLSSQMFGVSFALKNDLLLLWLKIYLSFWGVRGRKKKQSGSYGKGCIVCKYSPFLIYLVFVYDFKTNAKGESTNFDAPFLAFGWRLWEGAYFSFYSTLVCVHNHLVQIGNKMPAILIDLAYGTCLVILIKNNFWRWLIFGSELLVHIQGRELKPEGHRLWVVRFC